MAQVYKCDACGTIYENGECPKCTAEKEHSKKMNEAAVERIKKEAFTTEQAEEIERAWFEQEEEITLNDGKTYKIPPCSLKNAMKLMKLLKTINIDVIILNYVPTGNPELDEKRASDLAEVLMLAFTRYPEVTREYIEENIDVVKAKKIIEILIGLNSLKK